MKLTEYQLRQLIREELISEGFLDTLADLGKGALDKLSDVLGFNSDTADFTEEQKEAFGRVGKPQMAQMTKAMNQADECLRLLQKIVKEQFEAAGLSQAQANDAAQKHVRMVAEAVLSGQG